MVRPLLTSLVVLSSLCACSEQLILADEGGEGQTLRGDEEPQERLDTAEDDADSDVDADADSDSDADSDADTDPVRTWTCHESIRNGSEICDDAAFGVTDPYVPHAIYCTTGLGGIGYVSTNTGPTMSDGISRCQGWEENGMDAWDHLHYVAQLVCEHEGQLLEVNLRDWSGQTMWVGVHDHPDGGGHMTEVCIATQE